MRLLTRIRSLSTLAVVAYLAVVPTLAAQGPQRVTIDAWPTTTQYLAFAEFDARADGRIRITAGQRYSLYLNGDLVGADDDPATVETYEVEFVRRTNNIAVVVEHPGTAAPFGLFCVLEAEGVLLVSSPADRTVPWFWTDFPLADEADADWMTLRLNRLSRHEEDGQAVLWSPVQAGTLDPRQLEAFGDLDLTRANSVAGYAGGMDGSRGGLQLRTRLGENIAFNTFSDDPKLVDGDINTSVSFRRGASALLQRVETDLGALVAIDRVRVLTENPSRGTFEELSLRGYSILVSKDGVNYIEVGARNRIQTFRESAVDFPSIVARHVRLVVTEFSNRDASPRVGEMEVYGRGVASNGVFRSPPLDFGSEAPKNFDRVQQFGQTPDNTARALRFRSGADGTSWSAWSPWQEGADFVLDVPEPNRYLQFEARMGTRRLDVGPRLDSLVVSFDASALPATAATAAVRPTRVPMGVDTSFTYTLDLEVGPDDAGIDRLAILTQWPAVADLGAVGGLPGVAIDAARSYATNDSLVLAFDPPIAASATLTIPFQTRLLAASHAFEALLFAPQSAVALQARPLDGVDPATEAPFSLVAEAEDFSVPILSDVAVQPAVFSPNGDGANDAAVIGFTLARVLDAAVRVEIYSLDGRRVRTLDERRLDAGRHARVAGRLQDLVGLWDGRDDAGRLVPPGQYVYRIVVDLDPDDATASGAVGVVY